MDKVKIADYRQEMIKELKEDILPFWINNVIDKENGGYYGMVTNDLKIDKQADKGCILNSRILWTYSAAYRLFNDKAYLEAADQAYDFMMKYFWDKEYSGLYWMVDYKGNPVETKKQIYNIAFGIYALSEYYRVTQDEAVLKQAIELYECIEKYSYDSVDKGYIEALTRNWSIIEDMRLSEKDLNSKKSMNTHLHILEAYTNLYRVWHNDGLRNKLKELIEVTVDHIVDNNAFQFKLFFDEHWNSLNKVVSYGHDIEGSWLLFEAAEVLGDEEILERVKKVSIKMAEKAYKDGVDREFGGLFNERHERGELHSAKAWWPQSEAMVGFLNLYELTENEDYLNESYLMWKYVDRVFVDKKYGEWYNEVSRDGKVDDKMAKVDPWKCPYHNSRACFEVMTRLNRILK